MYPILLVRHGQSIHHVTELTGGWTDTGLTELGHRQAARVAERLARELEGTPYALYTSDLKRASETAGPIGAALGVAPIPEPDLREYNNGVAAGKTREQVAQMQAPRTYPLVDWRPHPGSETWREFFARTASCMERLTATGDPLLIVSHGGTLRNAIIWWLRLGAEAAEHLSFDIDPTSISALRVNQWGERTLAKLNDTGHLGDEA